MPGFVDDTGHGGKRAELTSDEDSVYNDACSDTSGQSDIRSIVEDVNDNEVDEIAQQEAFEEKLRDAIDGLTQKSAKGRTICFNGIEKLFAIKYFPDFVVGRKITITDAVERGLKKGRGEEQFTAARLSTLLCVQLGAYEMAGIVCRDLKPTLTFIASDNTASVHVRAEVMYLYLGRERQRQWIDIHFFGCIYRNAKTAYPAVIALTFYNRGSKGISR